MLPLESLKCQETRRRCAVTAPDLLSVLFSNITSIYGHNDLLKYCQSCTNKRKTVAVIIPSVEARAVDILFLEDS